MLFGRVGEVQESAFPASHFTQDLADSQKPPIFQAILSVIGAIGFIFRDMNTEKQFSLPLFLRGLWTKIYQATGTKYLIVLAFASGWMMIFDRYSVPAQLNMADQIDQARKDEQWYLQANEDLDDQRLRLETNEEELERLAREKYLMSKPNEVVFLIDEN